MGIIFTMRKIFLSNRYHTIRNINHINISAAIKRYINIKRRVFNKDEKERLNRRIQIFSELKKYAIINIPEVPTQK